ncbi:MAG: phosphate ABC transporter permease [Acidobacteria bacterium]|nr:MAG: phosphate ABC transporter permease [Acidobacteriota bacterium]
MTNELREMALEQVQFRELLLQITLRDLRVRYKQTIMGFGWAMFMPLVNTAVFSVIFMRVAPLDTGMPYPLFAYCGLLTWNFSAAAFRFAVTSLTGNSNLVTKVYFPREIFPISSVIVSFIDLLVGSLVLVGLNVYYRVPPTWMLMVLPAVLFVHVCFTVAVAMILAMANLFYRDVRYLFDIVLTLWMFSTSVLYPMSLVGGKTGRVLALNPMTPIIDAYRNVLIRGVAPDPSFGWTAGVTVVLLVMAWVAFHRAEVSFAENI